MKNQVKIVGIIIVILLLILSLIVFFNQSETDEKRIYVSFPEDEWPHNEEVEWYYWTGHLETNEGRWFGYELVFFIYKISGQQMQVVHSAVTDIQKNTFNYTIESSTNPIPRSGEPLQFEVGVFSASLNNGNDKLYAEVDNYTIDLELKSLKPPVLQHGTGYKAYEFGGYTYYYSRTRINTTGTITFKNESYQVNGTSWFDHQWGNLVPATLLGWDWYAIQLDDGREIMLFDVHSGQERLLVGGTLIDVNGTAVEIMPEEFTATVLDEWVSSKTGATYPSGWKISVKDIDLILQPVVKDQEVATNNYAGYWEGACNVEGNLTGRAYVELMGYLGKKQEEIRYNSTSYIGGKYNANHTIYDYYYNGIWISNGMLTYSKNGEEYIGWYYFGMKDAFDWIKTNTSENSTILCWWDYGHMIEGYSERRSVATFASLELKDTFWLSLYEKLAEKYNYSINWASNKTNQDIAKVLTSTNISSTETKEIIEKYNVSYILTSSWDKAISYVFFNLAGKNFIEYIVDGQPTDKGNQSLIFKMWDIDPQIYGLQLCYPQNLTESYSDVRIFKVVL